MNLMLVAADVRRRILERSHESASLRRRLQGPWSQSAFPRMWRLLMNRSAELRFGSCLWPGPSTLRSKDWHHILTFNN